MPNKRSRALRRWASKKRTFRRRWPVYLAMSLICVTSVAVIILIMDNFGTTSRARESQSSNVPMAIR